ncbi:MAG: dihydropteroate synthase, partial [Acidobacteria bacterium]|nr:dihydropteroate synthase [Acidobacteriota bacterium]
MRPVFTWNLGSRTLELGRRTLVMGIVNVTPDSFSDGGEHFSADAAIAHAIKLLDDGADLVDIGGESTRPGSRAGGDSPAVSVEEELRRVMPVVSAVRQQRPSALVSIDTYKSKVAREAVAAGASVVNDVSGFQWDPQTVSMLAGLDCGAILMHTRGQPGEWQSLPPVPDMVTLVRRELRQRADAAVLAGIKHERLVLDPGFGFGKGYEGDYALLRRFDELVELGFPLAAGVSRKSFIGR